MAEKLSVLRGIFALERGEIFWIFMGKIHTIRSVNIIGSLSLSLSLSEDFDRRFEGKRKAIFHCSGNVRCDEFYILF